MLVYSLNFMIMHDWWILVRVFLIFLIFLDFLRSLARQGDASSEINELVYFRADHHLPHPTRQHETVFALRCSELIEDCLSSFHTQLVVAVLMLKSCGALYRRTTSGKLRMKSPEPFHANCDVIGRSLCSADKNAICVDRSRPSIDGMDVHRPETEMFCLRDYDAYGFDIDHTLAKYNLVELFKVRVYVKYILVLS